MKKELQDALYAKYPKIFRQKYLSMQETCMCWGIDCGDGWYSLLDNLCRQLQSMTDNNPHLPDIFPQIEAVQVKEKYGTLRFYVQGSSDWQDGVISFAEHISGTICDECGKPGETNTDGGWLATRCEEHKQ